MGGYFSREKIDILSDWIDSDFSETLYKYGGKGFLKTLYDDDEIFNCSNQRMTALAKTPWTLEGGGEGYDLIYSMLEDHYEQLVRSFAWAPLLGMAVTSFHLNKEDLKIKEIQSLPFNRYRFRKGRLYLSNNEDKNLNPLKYIVTRYLPSDERPEGEPIYTRLIMAKILRTGVTENWAKFSDKCLLPFLIGKTEAGATNEERRDLFNQLVKLRKGGVMTIPNGIELDFLEATKNSSEFQKLTKHAEHRIQKSILNQSGLSDGDAKSSYASSKTYKDVRDEVVESDALLAQKSFNDLIKKYYKIRELLKSPVGGDIPTFYFSIKKDFTKEDAEKLVMLKNAGITLTSKGVEERLNLHPEHFSIDSEAERSPTALSAMEQDAPPLSFIYGKPSNCNHFSNSDQDHIDKKVSALLDFKTDYTDQVEKIINKAKNEDELKNALEEVYKVDDEDLKEYMLKQAVALHIDEYARANEP